MSAKSALESLILFVKTSYIFSLVVVSLILGDFTLSREWFWVFYCNPEFKLKSFFYAFYIFKDSFPACRIVPSFILLLGLSRPSLNVPINSFDEGNF